MEVWDKINKITGYVQVVIVLLMMLLVAMGIFIFFSTAIGYESTLTSGKFITLLGDVFLILITVELMKTIIIYVTQGAFYVQGIISAILIGVCRNVVFIKFDMGTETLIYAVAASILVLTLVIALKYAPKRMELPLPKNIKEISILMENVPGALASAASIMARHNANIVSGQVITTAKGEGNWIGLIEVNDKDVGKLIDDLKKHELIKNVEITSEK